MTHLIIAAGLADIGLTGNPGRVSIQIRSHSLLFLPGDLLPKTPNGLVIPGQKDSGNFASPENPRPRVLWIIERPVGKCLIHGRALIGENPRNQSDNGIHHQGAGKFTSRQDIIPRRPFLKGISVKDPLVDPLIMATEKKEGARTFGPLPRHLLHKTLALRGRIYKSGGDSSRKPHERFN
jgi:hypothetical protein